MMPVLATNVEVSRREPDLLVENRFQPGIHVFRLVVVDDAGNESRPALLSVVVRPGRTGGLGGIGDVLRDLITGDPSGPEDRE